MSATVPHRDELEADAQRLLAERREQAAADELAATIVALREQKAQEAAEARESAQRETALRAHEKAATAEQEAVRAVVGALSGLRGALRVYVESEYGLQDAAVAAERRYKSEGESIGDLVAAVCQEAGLPTGGSIGFVHSAWRQRLRAIYQLPLDEPDGGVTGGVAVSVANEPYSEPRCSICQHGLRAQIEEAMSRGLSLRTIEGEYGVSRSAVARHARHT